MATTVLADIIDDADVFGKWVLEETTKHSNIDQSPIIVDDPELNEWLEREGNLKWTGPRWNSLDRTQRAKIITQADAVAVGGAAPAAPLGITTFIEEAVRSERSQWWSASKLAKYLNLKQADPVQMILNDIASYWAYERMIMFLNAWAGVFADNDAAPGGSEHEAGDLTHNVSALAGGSFDDGVTNFTAKNFIDACQKMGDRKNDLGFIVTHSVVESTMETADLLDTVKDSQPGQLNSYRGRPIIVNDDMTKGSGAVYHTYIFGAGSTGRGVGTPDNAFELSRHAEAGNGAGQEVAWSRARLCYHPYGHRFTGTPAAVGGVSNAELATAGNWLRTAPERKMIKAVRLITREA
jgi:hypothetical protein